MKWSNQATDDLVQTDHSRLGLTSGSKQSNPLISASHACGFLGKICLRESGMSDDDCFHLQTFYGSLTPAAGFPQDFSSRGSH
jgi:hypothetical protein